SVLASKHLASNLAHMVQLFQWNDLLVSGKLEDAISRGIQNWPTSTQVLLAEFLDDLGARSRFVAEHLAANRLLKSFHHVRREAIGISGQRFLQDNSRNLPVTCRTIFSCARFCHASVGSPRVCPWGRSLDGSDVAQPN